MKSLKNYPFPELGDVSLRSLRFMHKDANPGLMYNRGEKELN